MLFADVEHFDIGGMFPCIARVTEVVQVDGHDFARRPIDCHSRGLRVARWQEHLLASDFQVLRSRHWEIRIDPSWRSYQSNIYTLGTHVYYLPDLSDDDDDRRWLRQRSDSDMTDGAEKPVFTTTTVLDVASSLDSLLSPKGTTPGSLSPLDSVAESDYNFDITLEDDSRFSTVPLSERASVVDQAAAKLERRSTISSAPSKALATLRHFAHRRSTSSVTTSDISGGNILARLGIQKAHDEHDLDGLRAAGGGQQKLHEEFLRLHNERQTEATPDEEASIDWGQSKL